MTKKSILIICNDLSVKGGTGIISAYLSKQLSKFYKTTVLSIDGETKREINGIDSEVDYLSLGINNRLRLRDQIIKDFFPFLKLIKKNKYDLFILIGTYGAIETMYPLHYLQNKPVIFCDHGTFSTLYEHPDRAKLLEKFNKWFDATVVLLPTIKYLYSKRLNVDADKIYVIPNPIKDELLKKRQLYDVSSKKIITVSRLDAYKGLELIAQVAKTVLAKHSDWSWDIYGEGPYREELEKIIKDLNLVDKLSLKGEKSKLDDVYPEYALNVFGSRREGLPLVLLEAKAFGIPSVSFNIETGPSDVIEDGVNGYLIKPFDTKKMADRINYLIEHSEIRKQFSDNAEDKLDLFKESTILGKWRELIDSLIKKQ